MIFSWALAIPIGVIVAVRHNSMLDRGLSFFSFLGMSVPAFFLAFLAMDLRCGAESFRGRQLLARLRFTRRLEKDRGSRQSFDLADAGAGRRGCGFIDAIDAIANPEIKNSEFVRTARAKGLPERTVIYKHVLRNALNPFVTMAGYGLADLLGGAALVETVMNLQGLGLLL